MPGRQAHGRSLTQQPSKAKNRGKASKARSQTNALNAFGIAQEHFPAREKKTPRFRGLNPEIERKHGRDEDDEDEEDEEEDEDEQPRRKKARPAGDDGDYGSDSEGNEWRLGGLMEDDNDSEIESDDAFGDSDNEKFDEYHFRGTKSKPKKKDDSESEDGQDDSDDEEGQTLGAGAIDLATALDQWEEESEDEPKERAGSDSDDESGSADSDSDEDEEDDDSDSDDGDEPDADKLEALKGLVSGYGDGNKKIKEASVKQKIDLGDLGLNGIDDPFMKNSLKLMNKEAKEKRPGATKKLDIPVSRREQGRQDRAAAYDKTNETLARWNDTVKQNRRAEHLSFPLAPDSGKAGLDTTTFQPIKPQPSTNAHEADILSILDQAGLTEQPKKEKEKVFDDDGNELTRKEIIAKKRMERAQADRETKRAARVKKIKSKAYRRVHRHQRERDGAAIDEAEGEFDSDAEREAQDRRRALERVGQRHKESKWAKMGKRDKRAVWDDEFRAGLGEMARKEEELRRRKEGKAVDSDETSSSGSDSDDDAEKILQQVNAALAEKDDEPQKGIMGMKFMRNAEEAKRKERNEELERVKRDLEEEVGIFNGDEDDQEVGRRTYGGMSGKNGLASSTNADEVPESAGEEDDQLARVKAGRDKAQPQKAHGGKWSNSRKDKAAPGEMLKAPATNVPEKTYDGDGAWSAKTRKSKSRTADLDPTEVMTQTKTRKPSAKSTATKSASSKTAPFNKVDGNDSDDSESHLPLAIRDQELIDRTFAGDDVLAEFEAEKDDVEKADDDKVIDNTIPGWGSWVGEGVSAKELKRNSGRYVTKVEGIKKKNRQDAKLDRVIINEKRNKKNAQYLATQVPHPYESWQQYERAMRLPVGPEWQTKETFQDSTKPRVLMKQGVIAPMAKPH